MNGGRLVNKLSALLLYITVKWLHVKNKGLVNCHRTVVENLKIGERASKLSCQRFMKLEYFVDPVQCSSGFCLIWSMLDGFQVCGKSLPAFVRDVFRRVSYLMDNAPLVFRLEECCSNRFLDSCKPTSSKNKDVTCSTLFSSVKTQSQHLELSLSSS